MNAGSTLFTARLEGATRFVATERNGQRVRLTLTAQDKIEANTSIRVLAGRFRSLLDKNGQKFKHWQLHEVHLNGSGAIEIEQAPPASFSDLLGRRVCEAELGHLFVILELRVTEVIQEGADLVIDFDVMLSHQAPLESLLLTQVFPPDSSDYISVGEPYQLQGVPGPAVDLVARIKNSPNEEGGFPFVVHQIDGNWNPVREISTTEPIDTELIGAGEIEESTIRPATEAPVRLQVKSLEDGLETISNPITSRRFHGRRIYFGEIHFHSQYSGDGDRTVEQAYHYARDQLCLDFAGVSDHTPTAEWAKTCEINEQFDQPGRFVTMPGWEWSTDTGHANIYLRNPEVPVAPGKTGECQHPGDFDWPKDSIVIPHHTNIRSAQTKPDGSHYWHAYDWSLPNRRVRLVEIAQTRGNFEADELDEDWGIVTSGIGASVQDALAMGYRIGFVGGTDNHTSFPTRDPQMGRGFGGMTGILADELSRESLWQAMDARRTYATSGTPIIAHWTLNGLEMGQEGKLEDGIKFSAVLYGTAPIERVEVISNGKVIWRSNPNAYDVVIEEEDIPNQEGESAYYYLRLRQEDGHRAWLSPIWLDEAI